MGTWRASWVALALAVLPAVASAEENGIRVGDGRLHPYFEMESRYDTMVGYIGEGADLNDYGDLGLHYRPGLVLEVPSESVAFDVSAALDAIQYLGMENEGTSEHSRVDVEAEAAATFNPEGNVYFKVEDTFRRSDKTTMLSVAVGTVTDYNLARFRLGFQPGAKALVIEPGYSLAFEHFESAEGALPEGCEDNSACDPDSVSAFDYLTHTAHLDAAWKFLPKTALVLQSSFAHRSYIGELEGAEGGGAVRPNEKFGSDSLKVMAGLTGLISSKFAVTALAGWGDQLKGNDVGFKSPIAMVEAAYLPTERIQLKAGYARTFESQPDASLYYGDDRVYGNVTAGFGEKFEVTGEASFDNIAFGDLVGPDGEVISRTDGLVRLALAPTYKVNEWFDAGLGVAVTSRETSLPEPTIIDYNRQEYFARIRASY